MPRPRTITTYLWFNGNAEAAVESTRRSFPNSRVTKVARWGEGGPAPAGSVMTISFELDGQGFIALNGGPEFPFTPAISLLVTCKSQADVDDRWRGSRRRRQARPVRMADRQVRRVLAGRARQASASS